MSVPNGNFFVNCVRNIKHINLTEEIAANLNEEKYKESVCVWEDFAPSCGGVGGGMDEKVRGEPSVCGKSVAEWRWSTVASGSSWHAAYLHVPLAGCTHLFNTSLNRTREEEEWKEGHDVS